MKIIKNYTLKELIRERDMLISQSDNVKQLIDNMVDFKNLDNPPSHRMNKSPTFYKNVYRNVLLKQKDFLLMEEAYVTFLNLSKFIKKHMKN